jgi:glycine/D-amino acid oxidase-like deaminating enzyme
VAAAELGPDRDGTASGPEVWDQIGWQGHEILGDFANAYCYCQRTREGRITVGARGVPYRYGSNLDTNGAPDAETIRRLTAILHRHFPAAAGAKIDHAWCGVLGVPRDWCATVGLDPVTGLGWAGGYVGVGVSRPRTLRGGRWRTWRWGATPTLCTCPG